MQLFFKSVLTAIAVFLFFGAVSVVETKAQPSVFLQEILKRMETHRNLMSSLQTNVKMVKINAQLGESETSEGKAIYVPAKGRDALVRIDWTKPLEETLTVASKKYVIYRPRLKQAITGSASDAQGKSGKANNLFAFISMSKAELKASYDIEYIGLENVSGGIPTWRVEMTPKAAASYKTAEMWVDGNGMPIQVKITETNKDTTTVLLSGMVKNKSIQSSVFVQTLPKDTKWVK